MGGLVDTAKECARAKGTWQAPESGWMKINIDGAFSETWGEAGIGVTIRNHQGQVALSAWKYIYAAGSAEQVEALACREGLALAAEWVPSFSVLESDCQSSSTYHLQVSSGRPLILRNPIKILNVHL